MTGAEITAKLALFHPFCDKCIYTIPDSKNPTAKTLPDGVAHTYMAYIREYPSGNFVLSQSFSRCSPANFSQGDRYLKVNCYETAQ